MRLLSVLALSAGLFGCEAFEDKPAPQVLGEGPLDITCRPPDRITFDDVDPVGYRFHPIFGNADLIHRSNSSCCAIARCSGARYPAVVDINTCFEAIDDYRRLKSSGLPSDSPDYILLLSRANEKFGNVLAQYLQDANLYDTVFARGTIRLKQPGKAIPELTSEIVAKLRAK